MYKVVKTDTGDLTFQTGAANGNIILTPHGSGYTRVNSLTASKPVFTDAS